MSALEAAALDPGAAPVAVPDQRLVPPVGGEWAEVRTLVVGEVAATSHGPKATALSYVSELATAADFSRRVLGELTRRGVSSHPGPIVAITDGAVWIQELLDLQYPQAVRILDIMHAIAFLADAAKAAFGPGTAETSEWLAVQRHTLRRGDAGQVLAALTALPAGDTRDTAIHYLSMRQAMLDYARCDAAGWPVGSGTVESANKLVIEARLKGAGMQWSRPNVNPMLALRTVDTNGRWAEAWPAIWDHLRRPPRPSRLAAVPPAPAPPPPPAVPASMPPAPRAKTIVNGKPTPDHPWNRSSPFRAKR